MLTDREIRALKPKDKPYKVRDGAGLVLQVMPSGSRLWHYRYEIAGREKKLSIGQYPEISLVEARRAREAARELLRAGKDPSVEKRVQKLAARVALGTTFEVIARAWHEEQRQRWTATHAADVLGSFVTSVFPALGRLPLSEITPPMVLVVLRDVERRGAIETAHRIRQRMSAVFQHAVAHGWAASDPAVSVQRLLKPVVRGRQPAITDIDRLRQMLRDADKMPAQPVTKLALRFLALTVVRPGQELLGARLPEIEDLDGPAPVWRVPASRMKVKTGDHVVPLAPQAVDVVRALIRFIGPSGILFPSARTTRRAISNNAIGYLLNRAGYHGQHVPHGWRAAFSSVMNERHRLDRAVIDLMLAHVPKDKVEAAYNRARHLERRRELAEEWAGLLLDGLPGAAEVVEGPRR
ncbi:MULTISPECIES: tyrosine-type recombinase/integrase [Roseomonadaceae]|uniref:Integrase arm-type DNA-binding domain-containing protein n=1 Tax=Falsiroseomonas oleicola TaxID=2801474 RepID=A0ABS6HF08_9PROT|nr:integrase arm-type DNA-binding domain-containing protein [Roseomonas oleicola]MBU8546974.1 integrase arm-type DNA-binding domain-containing protein [Roseomonas oleicola]